MELPDGYEYRNGFIHQKDREEYYYDLEYKEKQSTNVAMSYLRLGWLSSHIPYEELREFTAVDVGSGNGEFAKCAKNHLRRVCEYDLAGDSISREELLEFPWDLAVFSDEFVEIPWRYAMVSFPQTPEFDSFEEMREWRHFKPNEHLWYMTGDGFVEWASTKIPNLEVVGQSFFEDMIRTRWDYHKPNISTVLLKR
jgi:hypothetical protein